MVAKCYTKTYGVDYHEKFAPIEKINIFHVLLSPVANMEWPLLQFDVKNTFLHGGRKEKVYMDLPVGTHVASQKGVVWKLRNPYTVWSNLQECGLLGLPHQWGNLVTHRDKVSLEVSSLWVWNEIIGWAEIHHWDQRC